MRKDDDCTAVKSPNTLRKFSMTISAMPAPPPCGPHFSPSGKWLTMRNITVPVRVTTKEWL
jgi:hypothetical protein